MSIIDIAIEAAARLNLTRGRDNRWRGRYLPGVRLRQAYIGSRGGTGSYYGLVQCLW